MELVPATADVRVLLDVLPQPSFHQSPPYNPGPTLGRSVVSVNDTRDSFLLNLRALELASERVKGACKGDDIDVSAIEAHFGLHAVYDLHEAYFRPRRIRQVKVQDDVYAATGGESVGALVLARGARTHRLVTFATKGGFGDLPYGMGSFGNGWIWKEHSWNDQDFQQRAAWYEARVRWRYLWVPLDEAWAWFMQRIPGKKD